MGGGETEEEDEGGGRGWWGAEKKGVPARSLTATTLDRCNTAVEKEREGEAMLELLFRDIQGSCAARHSKNCEWASEERR